MNSTLYIEVTAKAGVTSYLKLITQPGVGVLKYRAAHKIGHSREVRALTRMIRFKRSQGSGRLLRSVIVKNGARPIKDIILVVS